MNNEDAAREIVKVLKKPLIECIETVIEQRCYVTILHVLNVIDELKEKKKSK